MTDDTTRARRARRWADHDASIPYKDERLVRLNGTNRAGRRPHSFIETQRLPATVLLAANDNCEAASDAA